MLTISEKNVNNSPLSHLIGKISVSDWSVSVQFSPVPPANYSFTFFFNFCSCLGNIHPWHPSHLDVLICSLLDNLKFRLRTGEIFTYPNTSWDLSGACIQNNWDDALRVVASKCLLASIPEISFSPYTRLCYFQCHTKVNSLKNWQWFVKE